MKLVRSLRARAPFVSKLLMVGALSLLMAGCQAADELGYGPKAQRPVSTEVRRQMNKLGMKSSSPIMLRIFKESSELEVWKQTRSGKFALLETFEICKWSGDLGPKFKEGDRQAPEGFYEITPALMNPNSNYHLAFNIGFPNRYDRAHGRTGSHLMVHGACSSRGCYAMTDAQVQDIYALARESFKGGQRSFQVQAFPFRMTAENMAKHHDSPHIEYWRMLKTGYDHFEVTKRPPVVDVCEKKYVFDATPVIEGAPFNAVARCPAYSVPPAVQTAVLAKQAKDNEEYAQIVASMKRSEERKKRWKETESQIAEFLGGGKADEPKAGVQTAVTGDAAGSGDVAASGATALASGSAANGLPVRNPARSAAVKQKDGEGFFGSLFGGGDKNSDAPVASAYSAEGANDSGGFFSRLNPFADGPAPESGNDEVTPPSKPQ